LTQTSEPSSKESRPDLSVSIVSADNRSLLLPCLRSIFENTHRIAVELFLVDNASRDETAEIVEAEFPQVRLIRNASRLGFSTNHNLALRLGRGRYSMLLNDDTVVLEGALDALVEFMDTHPRAGAVGSWLLNPDLSPQPAFADFPHPVMEAILPATTWSNRRAVSRRDSFPVDSVCGAAMAVRREVIQRIGLLDAAFDPSYSEEVDWCFRIRKGGWEIFTVPRSRIIHYGSVTMNRELPRKYELLLSHKALFFRKHVGEDAANVYRLFLGLTTGAKVAWWGFRSLLDRSYQERRNLHWHLLKAIPRL
jgi:GT2 family glycosyltransferase